MKIDMHPTTLAIRNDDKTARAWVKDNGFSLVYTMRVIHEQVGNLNFGMAKKIVAALKRDGYWRDAKKVNGKWVEIKSKMKKAA